MSPRSVRSASTRSQLKLAVSTACCTLLLASVVGCGSQSDDGDTATDGSTAETSQPDSPSPSSSTSPSTSSGDDDTSESGAGGTLVVAETVEPGQTVIVSASNVKVEMTERASALIDDKAVDVFLAATDEQLAGDVRSAVTQVEVPADSTLFGSVVSVGCETPTSVDWTRTFEGIEARATLPKPSVQCLVPVTSVALFLVPTDVG